MAPRTGQESGSAAVRAAAIVLCVMLVMLDSFADAATMNVGGRAGWTVEHNYGHMTARRGDTLVFNYNQKAHNVLQVSAADYNRCLVPARPMKAYSSGKDFVRLNTPGTYYFLCGVQGHCASGMKLAVTVR